MGERAEMIYLPMLLVLVGVPAAGVCLGLLMGRVMDRRQKKKQAAGGF